MNKIIWYIFIPTLIFTGILFILGLLIESQHFYWLQNFEMFYLFSTLIIGFVSFRVWRMGPQFRSIRELKMLLKILILVFALDVTNTVIYLTEGHGLFWEKNIISPAGAVLVSSLMLLFLAVMGLLHQVKLAKVKSH